MEEENLLCMICCLSYKKQSRRNSGQEVVEIISKFSEDILSQWKPSSPPKRSKVLNQQTGDNGVSKRRKKGKKGDLGDNSEIGETSYAGGGGSTENLIGGEGKLNVKDILESCVADTDNMSICPDCVNNIKSATDARAQAVQIERQVRKLQLVLLKRLRSLQRQMKQFYDEMKKIETSISNTNDSYLEAILSQSPNRSKKDKASFSRSPTNQNSIRSEQVFRLRHQISEVSRDLRQYGYDMRDKFFFGSNEKEDDDLHIPQGLQLACPIPNAKIDSEEDPCMDFNNEDDAGFDFMGGIDDEELSQFEAEWCKSEALPKMSTENEALNPELPCEENQKTRAKRKRTNKNQIDEDSSEPDANDSNDDDYNPLKVPKRKGRIDHGDRISFKGDVRFLLRKLPEFKRKVVQGVMKKRRSNYSLANYETKTERTPFHKHMMELEYHPDKRAVFLGGILIHILDKEENPEVENGLECSVCSHRVSEEVEKMELAMYDHIISKHFDAYGCPMCEMKLDTDLGYRTHIKQCRKSVNVIVCDICEKPLSSRKCLQQHKWHHMNDEEKEEALANGFKPNKLYNKDATRNYACEICPKKFVSQFSLSIHAETHKSREEREQYICPHCGKNFLKAGYDYHVRYSECAIESGNSVAPTRLQCKMCDKSLKNKVLLRRHMKFQHSDSHPRNLYQFVCVQCGKAFKSKPNLKKHTFYHTGLKPFKCSRCSSAFACRNNLTRHEKTCRC